MTNSSEACSNGLVGCYAVTSSLVLCDSGDHLHPNARGYERMAGAIPLTVVRKPTCR